MEASPVVEQPATLQRSKRPCLCAVVYDMNGREAEEADMVLGAMGDVGQYIFCSSAGVYLKSPQMPHHEVDAVDPKSRHKVSLSVAHQRTRTCRMATQEPLQGLALPRQTSLQCHSNSGCKFRHIPQQVRCQHPLGSSCVANNLTSSCAGQVGYRRPAGEQGCQLDINPASVHLW